MRHGASSRMCKEAIEHEVKSNRGEMLKRRNRLTYLFLLAAASTAQGQSEPPVITVSAPMTIELPRPPHPLSAHLQLVVPVIEYRASSAGPVSFVVILHCQNKNVEIGRFGILGEIVRSQRQYSQQNFGFLLPKDPDCKNARAITVSLQPTSGDGSGARMTLGDLVIQ